MCVPIIYSKDHYKHDPKYEIYDGVKEPYAEKPERLTSIVSALKNEGLIVEEPTSHSLKIIEQLHQKDYVQFLKSRSEKLKGNEVLYPSYYLMDTYTPITSGTYQAAVSSVNTVLTGADRIISGDRLVYSLCRPPGHHAEQKAMGGYCYFNNAAIVGEYLSKKGRVAILDVDFHHGNGTQSLFYERSDVLYVSVHADPQVRFPYSSGYVDEVGHGDGAGFTKNYPLPLGITNDQYMKTLKKALKDVRSFDPEYLIVSLGFDTYEKDPIGGFLLTVPFYRAMGQEIATLEKSTLLVQEGGYFVNDLGKMATSFLCGVADLAR